MSLLISVVSPVYNEEQVLPKFYDAVSTELDKLDKTTYSWELILVNDGSRDGSLDAMRSIAERDSRVRVVDLAKNCGTQIAASAGIEHARGDAVVTIDSDLQQPPRMIHDMIRLWQEGYHHVYTCRTYDESRSWLSQWKSDRFQDVLNFFSGLNLPNGISDFRLLDRRLVNELNALRESPRYLRGLIYSLGFKQTGIPFAFDKRAAGETKFTLRQLLHLSFDGIIGFSTKPLRWISYFGMSVAFVGLVYAAYIAFRSFVHADVPGWPTIVVAILVLGGVQLLALGIIGEYVGRIYMATKKRPLYVVQEHINFEQAVKKSDETNSQQHVLSIEEKKKVA